jgi:hypothetical protein
MFPYAPFPCHKVAKRNFIKVIKGTNATPPHHKGLMLAYLMENETPLVYHVVEWQGCGYTIKDNKNLNEWTRGHPKTKPQSRLMQARWEQKKVLNRDDHGGLDYMNWVFDKNVDNELTFDW